LPKLPTLTMLGVLRAGVTTMR